MKSSVNLKDNLKWNPQTAFRALYTTQTLLSVHLSICPSVHLSICLSVYLSICLSVCLLYLILSDVFFLSMRFKMFCERKISLVISRQLKQSLAFSIPAPASHTQLLINQSINQSINHQSENH